MRLIYSLLLCCWGMGLAVAQQPNDHIFPAAAAARNSIDFDKKGFFIKGQRTFLVSAGIEYARVPRALWRDRLLRLQRCGFNCVEVYTFWNWHEPREGAFEFSGEKDLGAFLKLVQELGMYSIVRVGPYYCAEWDNGGYPLWLKFKPGLRVREPNEEFQKYVGLFFDRLLPIVLRNQVHKGGSVIMVQLENEHPLGWGTDMPNSYFTWLQQKALSLGLEVPYFFSGLHHANDPAGDAVSLDDASRPNPWFSTEFWSVWYNGYGSGEKEAKTFAERTWKIIARGGAGYNYYMAHGGSNFGYTNNDEDAASYDYGAAVGQAGDLRPIYYAFKKAAWFARSFVGAKVDFSGKVPVVKDCLLAGDVRMVGNSLPLLGLVRQGEVTTLIAYGVAGSKGRMEFSTGGIEVTVPAGREPSVYWMGKQVRVLVMNDEAADRCWIIGDKIVVGPRYVGEMKEEGFETEDTVGALLYTGEDTKKYKPVRWAGQLEKHVVVGEWKRVSTTGVAEPGYDASSWKYSEWPLQMGADGDSTASAWYRTEVRVAKSGEYTLLVEGADRVRVYVDGKAMDSVDIKAGAIGLRLGAGRHVLAVFTAHDGRDKLPAYIGGLDSVARKGLFGRTLLVKGAPAVVSLTDWKVVKDGVSRPYKIGEDVFDKKQGVATFETVLPEVAAGVRQAELRFASVDENADVYINDRKLTRHEGWNSPFNVLLDGVDTMRRPIRLRVVIENFSNEGGIDQPVRFSPFLSPVEVRGWRMKGGMGDRAGKAPGPCWWSTDFMLPENPRHVTIWRIVPEGLGHGSVWVNGYNLGRYPEKVPAPGLYIPECWLHSGRNSLRIFDEDGKDASKVSIVIEEGATRPKQLMEEDLLGYVNPFIGTTKSDVYTRWGNEGGTYPGAVAPWGYWQLTPETRKGGYDYGDSVIERFSSYGHASGFPNGSAGRFYMMPGDGRGRPFSHADEEAEPGYYKVRLKDDGTVVEATAGDNGGVFRVSFPEGVASKIFVGDSMQFSVAYTSRKEVEGGVVYSFDERVVEARIGNVGFDALREMTREEWRKALSVVDVEDEDVDKKTIFYTALYHSLLVPWRMPGGGYGQFSPWDSYRSLHPLLSLLYPEKQKEMLLSMMDKYKRDGHLPVESMTGNHSVPILVDAWLKGLRIGDSSLLYDAMLKSLVRGPFVQDDRTVYSQLGYIPMTYPESVTRTVEYGYDDWVLAQYARKVMGDGSMADSLERRSMAYRHLLYIPSLLLLPRVEDSFRVKLGNSGYKEGDAWVYSYFAPHDPGGLIDLMGGEGAFCQRLDSALRDGRIVFDNETVLHLPYFFNEANRHGMTVDWVRKIMSERYSNRPGGLPGNDDLGAMSSWYVFSAMGLFPSCPGSPVYSLGEPVFRKVTVHLENGKDWIVRRLLEKGSLLLNGKPFGTTELSHAEVMKGGELVFREGADLRASDRRKPSFVVSGLSVDRRRVKPGEEVTGRFVLENKGSTGVYRVAGYNFLVEEGKRIDERIGVRLYKKGKQHLRLDSLDFGIVEVVASEKLPVLPIVDKVDMRVMFKDSSKLQYGLKNIGWKGMDFRVPVRVDGRIVGIDTVGLDAGEERFGSMVLVGEKPGWHVLKVGDREQRFRVYSLAADALVLDLDSGLVDRSGFGNKAVSEGGLIRIKGSPSLDDLGERLTMMIWVRPEERVGGLVDVFTNGDNHVLQVVNGKQLSFFAGGWGRGDCTVDLPADWVGKWHLIAGVCDKSGLRVYIDGQPKGFTPLEKNVHLSGGDNVWMVGGNEEFPGQRFYKGGFRRPRIFVEALSEKDILTIYSKESTNP
ncbi:MAG: GH92 family glycosyl hydrolase [Bacteroidetes bacterium]|nr:GH92 family glycosyl hydrolase [Bacteroidota bacterium]